jgi:polysaccharide pyruvyl transferase WcaK-like protein
MKIAVCGLVKSENLGEQFIAKSLSWIIEEELKSTGFTNDIEFVYVDIKATNDITKKHHNAIRDRLYNLYSYTIWGIPADIVHFKLKDLASKINSQEGKNTIYRIRHFMWKHSRNLGKRFQKYYDEKFNGVDIIVIDGAGLLEYSYNAYQEALASISEYAEDHNIPLVFNAIGRAGEFDPNDYRCKVLMGAFNKSCVRYVSARDSRDEVQECVGERFNVKLLADAAFCVDEAYGVEKKSISNLIGIGLIRGNASLSYTEGFGEEDWIDLFSNIASELQKRGYKFEFFTNGMSSDYELGRKVIKRLGIGMESLVERPTEASVLLKTISEYSGIITCRMHSSIAAFSMGIPSVILSWNKKVDRYMDIVGYPERAISQSKFKAELIVDQMEKALIDGIDQSKRLSMKGKARESVKDYIYLLKK